MREDYKKRKRKIGLNLEDFLKISFLFDLKDDLVQNIFADKRLFYPF